MNMIPPLILAAILAPPVADGLMRSGRHADRRTGAAILELAVRVRPDDLSRLRAALADEDAEVRSLASGVARRVAPPCIACFRSGWIERTVYNGGVTWGSYPIACPTCHGWGLDPKWLGVERGASQ